jgi:hypothetical protein
MWRTRGWENACLTCPDPMTGATSFSVCAPCSAGSYLDSAGAHWYQLTSKHTFFFIVFFLSTLYSLIQFLILISSKPFWLKSIYFGAHEICHEGITPQIGFNLWLSTHRIVLCAMSCWNVFQHSRYACCWIIRPRSRCPPWFAYGFYP